MLKSVEFISSSVEHTARIGQHLGKLLDEGDVICLAGDLGAGKTAFAKGVGAGWGVQEPVTSPTFTLMHEHRRSQDHQVLYHVDCYRLHGSTAAWGIGLDDVLDDAGSVIIEWPENIRQMIPAERLWISFVLLNDTRRQLTLQATGQRYHTLLDSLRPMLTRS